MAHWHMERGSQHIRLDLCVCVHGCPVFYLGELDTHLVYGHTVTMLRV